MTDHGSALLVLSSSPRPRPLGNTIQPLSSKINQFKKRDKLLSVVSVAASHTVVCVCLCLSPLTRGLESKVITYGRREKSAILPLGVRCVRRSTASLDWCESGRKLLVHELSDSVKQMLIPSHSFTGNGEWVCALATPLFRPRLRDALCWWDEVSLDVASAGS